MTLIVSDTPLPTREKRVKLSGLAPRTVFRFPDTTLEDAKRGEHASLFMVVEPHKDKRVTVVALTGQGGEPEKRDGDRDVIVHRTVFNPEPAETQPG